MTLMELFLLRDLLRKRQPAGIADLTIHSLCEQVTPPNRERVKIFVVDCDWSERNLKNAQRIRYCNIRLAHFLQAMRCIWMAALPDWLKE